jgi:hypothetical protein
VIRHSARAYPPLGGAQPACRCSRPLPRWIGASGRTGRPQATRAGSTLVALGARPRALFHPRPDSGAGPGNQPLGNCDELLRASQVLG